MKNISDRLRWVRGLVSKMTARWTRGPAVEVVEAAWDVPIPNVPLDAQGCYYRGKVWVCAHQPPWRVAGTLVHESLGHFGVRALLRGRWTRFMEMVHAGAKKDRKLKTLAKQIRKVYTGKRGRCDLSGLALADEITAHAAAAHTDAFTAEFRPRHRLRERWGKVRQMLQAPTGKKAAAGYRHVLAVLAEASRRMTERCRRAGQVMGRCRERSKLRFPTWKRRRAT